MPLRSLYNSIPSYLGIDTIESLCRKQERIARIKTGCFDLVPLTDSAKASAHLKRLIREHKDGVTSGLYAPKAPFNFAVINSKADDYKKARFIAYGLASYKRELTNEAKSLLNAIFTLCPVTSIDLCFDTPIKPNIDAYKLISGYYRKEQNTHYINAPTFYGIDKIKLYDKAKKDGLTAPLWRIEFTLLINVALRLYEPPIEEIQRIINEVTK